jgi:hypothetical protein
MLLVWMDIPADQQHDFHEWYDREHLLDRASVPGFLRGRRFQAVSGGPEFLAVYETREPGTLTSTAYRERLQHPTPWTRRIMPSFRNTIRGICERTVSAGAGAGGALATIRFAPDPARRWPLRGWLAETGLPRTVGLPGLVSGCLAEGMAEPAAKGPSAEGALRQTPDRGVDWALLLEGREPALVEHAARTLLVEIAEAEGTPPVAADVAVFRYLGGVTAAEAARQEG